jgi:hypothetical protein
VALTVERWSLFCKKPTACSHVSMAATRASHCANWRLRNRLLAADMSGRSAVGDAPDMRGDRQSARSCAACNLSHTSPSGAPVSAQRWSMPTNRMRKQRWGYARGTLVVGAGAVVVACMSKPRVMV